eukprot:11768539-Alexandrium_andersonii.AAC.1
MKEELSEIKAELSGEPGMDMDEAESDQADRKAKEDLIDRLEKLGAKKMAQELRDKMPKSAQGMNVKKAYDRAM